MLVELLELLPAGGLAAELHQAGLDQPEGRRPDPRGPGGGQ